ncbi:PEP-CTERM sorting domain-containing protein [Duganella sp. FT92W]|uniref:PEP-CTERM sorting domain-containing protein n=1 Tax=Pseudoduganella rivuli TaxID=2666085 RepID=A0A7X2IQL4_9BURK|nr:NF038120 family PEP-CTERM protein [Pseudoduganella rivuli]MRV74199.1 PEP-CTERM sorting domain-containing protein [Pseudoduganella rivuli]
MIRTRSILKSAMATAVFGATLWAPAAQASITSVVDFNTITPIALNGNESVQMGDYMLTAKASPIAQLFGMDAEAGSGMTIKAGDAACTILACPDSASQYYAGTNDGSVNFGSAFNDFQISALNFAFVGPLAGLPDASYGQLILTGMKVGGGIITASRNFAGQNANGDFMFDHWDLGTDWAQTHLESLSISSCIFTDTSCINSVDEPAGNMAQFAIDDLQLTTVPEPGSIALLMLGAAGMGMASRRRRAAK